MKSYTLMWKNYLNFLGRSSRSDFWIATLFNFFLPLLFGFAIIIAIIAFSFLLGYELDHKYIGILCGVLWFLYGLATFVPILALTIRRLHDVGVSGWIIAIQYFLIITSSILTLISYEIAGTIFLFISTIASLFVLFLICKKSEPNANKYGETTDN